MSGSIYRGRVTAPDEDVEAMELAAFARRVNAGWRFGTDSRLVKALIGVGSGLVQLLVFVVHVVNGVPPSGALGWALGGALWLTLSLVSVVMLRRAKRD